MPSRTFQSHQAALKILFLLTCIVGYDNPTSGQFVARLTAADGESGDFFGGLTRIGGQPGVSIYGDVVVVGAGNHDDRAGAVYVYERHRGGDNAWGQSQKIISSNADEKPAFGTTVSLIDESRLFVGAVGDGDPDPLDNELGAGLGLTGAPGAIHLIERSSATAPWVDVTKLEPPDDSVGDFGFLLGASKVVMSGSTVLTSSMVADELTGRVFVYNLPTDATAWQLAAELTADDDGSPGDFFGADFAIADDTLFVGAPLDDSHGGEAGEVYQFQRNNNGAWSLQKQFTASDTSAGDWFGEHVEVDGSTAIVASTQRLPHEDPPGPGAVYVFERTDENVWSESKKLVPSDGLAGDVFGDSIAISGDLVIVGATKDREHDGAAESPGAAYVFGRHAGGLNQWGQVLRLTSPDSHDGDQFGKSVALHDNTAVVAAPGYDSDTGVAYVFEITSPVLGDFDGSSSLDTPDVDLLSKLIHSEQYDVLFDVDGDGKISTADQVEWVSRLRNTYFGDANLDGQFNSTDLVQVFAAGQYEDEIDDNSSWATGDWNSDLDFTSTDLVAAFSDGGYENGIRGTVTAVPEPTSIIMIVVGLIMTGRRRAKL